MANFKPGVGRLATDRYDFQSHLDGTKFRHSAPQIDIAPLPAFNSSTTLDGALSSINTFINAELSKGEGFITVGDGYDSWANADALSGIYFDNTTPYLDDLLNPIFRAILDNGIGTSLEINPLPPQYERLKRGGVVLIKAGTYIVKAPIEVPPGIVLMGEGFGTKIINVSSLNLASLPPIPKVSPTPAPVFKIITDGYRDIDDAAISGGNTGGPTDYRLFAFNRKTIIYNLVISDNFVENTILGDVFYKIPQNKTGDNPLILQQQGSNLIIDNVYLMGRVNFSSGTIVSQASRFGVKLDGYSPNQNGTYLKINNSFIDGFSIPIDFETLAGSNDHLEVTNSKIRGFGYLDGNSNPSTNPESNTIIKMNDNNAIISNNHLFGNSDAIGSAVFINTVVGSSVTLQGRSKIIVSNNNLAIDKTKNVENTIFKPIKLNSSITNFSLKADSIAFGNSFQNKGFELYRDGYATVQFAVSSSEITINSKLAVNNSLYLTKIENADANTTYNASSSDCVILADSSTGIVNMFLPNAVLNEGQIIIIKDVGGQASVDPVSIYTQLSQLIDATAAPTIIDSNYGVKRFISDGANWFTI